MSDKLNTDNTPDNTPNKNDLSGLPKSVCARLSEKALTKDWLNETEDQAWREFQKETAAKQK